MATITLIRKLDEQGGDGDFNLVSAFTQNSIEFKFDRGTELNTYAKVEINGTAFFATLKTLNYETNTDLYEIDLSTILPAFLCTAPITYTLTGLSQVIGIDIKGYDSLNALIATNTSHPDIELTYGYPPIGTAGGLDNIYENGIMFGEKVYHNGIIPIYYSGTVGTIGLTLDDGATQQNVALVAGYNHISGSYFEKSGTLKVNGELGDGLSVPCIYRARKTGYFDVQWINKMGLWSAWNFRVIQKGYDIIKSVEVPIYASRNSDMYGKSFDLNTDKRVRYDLDTIAVDDLHYDYLCQISESPRVILNSIVSRVADISKVISTCKQNLKFNISLTQEENAVSY